MITVPPQMRDAGVDEMAYRKVAQQCYARMMMARGQLNMFSQRFRLENGVVITCSYCWGKQDVWINIPEVADVKRKQVVSVFTWFVSPLQQNDEGLQLPYHYPGETEGDAEDELPGTGLYDAEKNELDLRKNLMFGNRHFVAESKTAYSWNGPLSIYGTLPYPVKGQYVFSNGTIAREFGEEQIVLAYGLDQYEVALVATYKRNAYDELVTATYPPVLMVWKNTALLTHTFEEGQLEGGPYFVGTGSKIMMAAGGNIAYSVTTDINGDDKLEVTITKAVDTRQGYSGVISRATGVSTTVRYDYLSHDQLFGGLGKLIVGYLRDTSNSTMLGTGQNSKTVDLPVKFPILAPRYYGALTAYQADIWRVCFNSDLNAVATVQGMSFCGDDGSGAQIIYEGMSCDDFVNGTVHPVSETITVVDTCAGRTINVAITQNGYSATITISATAKGQTWVMTAFETDPHLSIPEAAASGCVCSQGSYQAYNHNGVWSCSAPANPPADVPNCVVASGTQGDCTFTVPAGGTTGANTYTAYSHNYCYGGASSYVSKTTYEARCL